MQGCNPTVVPVDIGTKLVKDDEENSVDNTLFKQLVGSL